MNFLQYPATTKSQKKAIFLIFSQKERERAKYNDETNEKKTSCKYKQ